MSPDELKIAMEDMGIPPFTPSGKPAPLTGRPDLEYEDEVYEAYLAGLEEDKEIERQAQKAGEEAAQKEPGSDP